MRTLGEAQASHEPGLPGVAKTTWENRGAATLPLVARLPRAATLPCCSATRLPPASA